ncbi:hypothetical protein ACHAPY_005618 [Fusarium culmorum]|uniref:Uncharacterized protein n=1 Tax=Fusarium culmorum TaxID=5516 RepID=A0A2T4H0Y5_FUSCU|nr:hypothetical protein FCULG_00007650 [Fusarium culmorum]
MSSSSDYSNAVAAQLRVNIDHEVALFLVRLKSLGVDDLVEDEIEGFETETSRPTAPKTSVPTNSSSSSSSSRVGSSRGKAPQQIIEISDVSDQIENYLEKKKLSQKQRDKRAEINRLEEEMADLDLQKHNLLNNAEIQRVSHVIGNVSTDIELNKILERYRASGVERAKLDIERQRLMDGIRRLQQKKRES